MWISHCGEPVTVCDGSDSDCWLMECGYITCVGECVHGGCNGHLYNPPPLSLSLLCSSGSAQARVPTPEPLFLVGCANETEPSVLAYCRVPRNTRHLLFSFFADLSILRPRVKGRSFGVAPPSGCSYIRQTAVVIREALSRYLCFCFCFLHLLAGFAVRLTTTHPSSTSTSVWWNCDGTIRDAEGSLHT